MTTFLRWKRRYTSILRGALMVTVYLASLPSVQAAETVDATLYLLFYFPAMLFFFWSALDYTLDSMGFRTLDSTGFVGILDDSFQLSQSYQIDSKLKAHSNLIDKDGNIVYRDNGTPATLEQLRKYLA